MLSAGGKRGGLELGLYSLDPRCTYDDPRSLELHGSRAGELEQGGGVCGDMGGVTADEYDEGVTIHTMSKCEPAHVWDIAGHDPLKTSSSVHSTVFGFMLASKDQHVATVTGGLGGPVLEAVACDAYGHSRKSASAC